MRRFTALLAFTLAFPLTAWSQDKDASEAAKEEPAATSTASEPVNKAWEGVYKRSGKTIKAGEYMGIAGGALMVVGGVTAIVGGVNVVSGSIGSLTGNEEGTDRANSGATQTIVGTVGAVAGFTSFTVGPALTAGGSVRQARAIRQINPDAPRPWLGYSAWASWAIAASPPLTSSILFSPIAYVLAGMQKGKNRLNWDTRTAAYYEQHRPRVTMNLTPITIDGTRGLTLNGTF